MANETVTCCEQYLFVPPSSPFATFNPHAQTAVTISSVLIQRRDKSVALFIFLPREERESSVAWIQHLVCVDRLSLDHAHDLFAPALSCITMYSNCPFHLWISSHPSLQSCCIHPCLVDEEGRQVAESWSCLLSSAFID